MCVFLCFSVSSKRKSRSERSCGGLRMLSQASAPVKPTTKSLSPLLPTQVRQELPGGFMCTEKTVFAVWAMQCHAVMLLYLIIKALNHLLCTDALNISHGKTKHCLYSVCVFMLHVRMHQIPQRGNLCLQCRCHQCLLLCLGARLLWRWDCPSSSNNSTAPTSVLVATPPPFPPAPASSPYTTPQPSPVHLNGWVNPATAVTSTGSYKIKTFFRVMSSKCLFYISNHPNPQKSNYSSRYIKKKEKKMDQIYHIWSKWTKPSVA